MRVLLLCTLALCTLVGLIWLTEGTASAGSTCDPSCLACMGLTANDCTNCVSGDYLENNPGQCKDCSPVANCASAISCTSAADSQCTACLTGSYFKDGELGSADTCPQCTPVTGCTSSPLFCTSASTSRCSACANGRYLDTTARPTGADVCSVCTPIAHCVAPTPIQCTTAIDSRCDLCAAGFYEPTTPAGQPDTCQSCPTLPNCSQVTCTNGLNSLCSACDAGFYLEPDGTCSACTGVNHCDGALTCSTATNSQCSSCDDGYWRSATLPTLCTECTTVDGCSSPLTCTSAASSICQSCDDGRYLSPTQTSCPLCNAEHFSCYDASDLKNPPFIKQSGITVVDQFGESTATANKPKLFCAAASHDGSDVVDPQASLCCYERNPLTLPAPVRIQTTDDFGILQLDVKKADLLCQSCDATGSEPVCAATDHFQCYEPTLPKKTKFTAVTATVADRFESVTVKASKPKLFCSAASQDGSETPAEGLCCYEAHASPLPGPIAVPVEDEFGSLQLQIKKSTLLCEPCTATLVP